MEWYFVLLIVVAIIIALYLLLEFICGKKSAMSVIDSKCYDYDQSNEFQLRVEGINPKEIMSHWKTDEFSLQVDNAVLFGYFIDADVKISDKTVVISHGINGNLIQSVKFAQLFREIGYNVVLYDHRHFGKSSGKYCTLGYQESTDLSKLIDFTLEHYSNTRVLGLHGESMGAATVLLTLSKKDNIDFVVSDCGFSDAEKLIKRVISKSVHMPAYPSASIARMFTKSYCGYDVYKVKPIESVKNSDTPILFIHGDADDFIPCKMSEDMYTASSNKQSQLLKVKNAYHAGSYKTDKQLYINTVKEFVEKIEKNKEIHI